MFPVLWISSKADVQIPLLGCDEGKHSDSNWDEVLKANSMTERLHHPRIPE